MVGRPEPVAAASLSSSAVETSPPPGAPSRGDPSGLSRRGKSQAAAAAPLPDYRELYDLLAGVVKRVCPKWLADGRDDILQAAVLRVLEAKHGSEPGNGLSPSYLWKVAYTATIDQIRRVRRQRGRFLDGDVAIASEPASVPDPLEILESRDLGDEIHSGLLAMNRRRRLVVGLHLIGCNVTEIMSTTGWGNRKVRNLLCRGLHELRDHLRSRGWRR